MRISDMLITAFILLFANCNSVENGIPNTAQVFKDSGFIEIDKSQISEKQKQTIKITFTDYYGNLNRVDKDIPLEQKSFSLKSPIIINVSIDFFKNESFILEKGDSVNITFIKDTFSIISKNRAFSTLSDFVRLSQRLFPGYSRTNDSLLNISYEKHFPAANRSYFEYVKRKTVSSFVYDKIGSLIKQNGRKQFENEVRLLDSLQFKKVITPAYKAWIVFSMKMNKIGTANVVDFFTEERNFQKNYSDYQFINDTLIDAFFYDYKGYLGISYLYAAILKYKRIKYPNGQSSYDFRIAFDSASGYVQGKSLDCIRFQCLCHIKEENSLQSFEIYKSKFYQTATDTLLINYVKNNLDNSDEINLSKSDMLKDFDGNIHPIGKIIKSGKVQYVDFWASWCAPCLQEIPVSIELHKKYPEEKIDFIYISTDADYAKWKAAVVQMKMQDVKKNYLLINSKESSIVKLEAINTLPRYLIFNSRNKLVYKDGPRPSNTQTKAILDELIKR